MAGVTLKDIARECKVSFSTVSKALKNSCEISRQTTERIRETAQRMGYHTNAAARTLRTKQSYNIGVIFEDVTGSGLQHQYFAKIFDSINVHANYAGYAITFLSPSSRHDYLSQARYHGCDGVIIASTIFQREDVRRLLESELPVCTLDYEDEHNHSAVLSDNSTGMKTLLEEIIAKGHRKIAYIHGEPSYVSSQRLETFRSTLAQHGIALQPGYLQEGRYHDTDASYRATGTLLAMEERPTCIIYPDDFAALGGIKALSEARLVPGRDIGIAGYDGILIATLLTPSLTTYEQDARELGRQLVAQVLENIAAQESFTRTTVFVSGRFRPGASVMDIH